MRALAVDHIVAQYPRFTLGPVTLTLYSGERVALLGRNGAGKSTLLSLMAGLRRADHGSVHLDETGDPDEQRLQLRQHVAYVGAGTQGLPWYTVRKHFQFLACMHAGWNAARAMDLARTLRLDLDATIGTLSRGNLVKLNLCGAWGQQARVLLLDEPTAGLDPVARAELLHELQFFIDAYPDAAVVYATHLLDELKSVKPERLLVLRDGTLREFDPADSRGYDVEVLTSMMTGLRSHSAMEGVA